MPEPPDIAAQFQPDYTPEQLENLGVYDALYRGQGPRLASLGEWKPEWVSEHDPKGWAQWYKRYASGRRIPDEDERQIKRWLSFKARHGGPFAKNPTPRRGWALRNWGIDPAKLVAAEQANSVTEMLDEYKNKATQKYVQERAKQAAEAAGALTVKPPITQKFGAALKWADQNFLMSGATSLANTALQHPIGQTALGGVAHAYNNYMPQAGKDMVKKWVPHYAEPESIERFGMQGKWQPNPFNDKSFEQGVQIDAKDTLAKTTTNTAGQANVNKNMNTSLSTYKPVEVTGTPLQQIGHGISGGVMPSQTFKPGQQAALHQNITESNDPLTGDYSKSFTQHLTPTPPDFEKQNSALQRLQKQSAEHILVSGHSGAGKSTLAKALAEKLQMPHAQVDHQPAFNEFLANNTPDNHLPAGSPKHEEFHRLMRETALKTLEDAKQPSIIEGSQLAYLPPEVLAKFKRVHVNPSLRQAYQQRLARTKQRYLKDPAKTWTPEVEEEKRRTADMVYDFHRPAFRDYDKLPGTVKYKPGQNLDRLLQRLQKQAQQSTGLSVQKLPGPQQFPKVDAAEVSDWGYSGSPPPIYQHPSGAMQLGRITYSRNAAGSDSSAKLPPPLPGARESPGVDSGPGVFRVDQHGGGSRDSYGPRGYAFGNPDGFYLNVADQARGIIQDDERLPPNTNPNCLITGACNINADGATPALYARWFREHLNPRPDRNTVEEQYRQHMGGSIPDGTTGGEIRNWWRQQNPAPPLNLNKVVMTPPGHVGADQLDDFLTNAFGDGGAFGVPYATNLVRSRLRAAVSPSSPPISAPHEYRLSRGADPTNENSWVDTGVYTDARQGSFPFIGLPGETQELGRHLGLSPELGGGNFTSYLDKVKAINNNPDATYMQKVRSNWARPIGNAAQFGREVGGLLHDTTKPALEASQRVNDINKRVLGPSPMWNKGAALQRLQKQSNDLTKLAPKWSDRAHLLAALPQHLTDTQTAIQNAGDIDKEMTDLALISRAWLKSQRQKALLAARLKKFQETAQYPSLAAVKQSAVYNFEGDVQGVSLRKTLHKVLDELKHPGLAYNNARTGEARAIIPGNKKKQQEVLDLLEFYLASRQHSPERPNSSRALQRDVDYTITPLPKQKEPLHKVVLKPDDIQKFIRLQGFNRLATENPDYQKQWLTERYRLQPDAAGNLSGRVPELAKKQLLSGEPIYEYQLAPGWQDVKAAELNPDVQLQEHQQRVQERATTDNPRMLIYHGLGSGKSLSAIAAAEAARKLHGDNYGVVVPASLRDNFRKEIKKFTTGASNPEVMSYTGLALGKKFQVPPETLIMDEAARLRNPNAASTRAASRAAQQAKRVLLLTGTPITNTPGDLAPLVSMLHGETIDPKDFEKRYVQHEKVWPGLWNFLRGIKPGVRAKVRRRDELLKLLEGRVDYHPSKKPEGVEVQEEVIETPLTPEQQKIEKAIRTTIPPGFLWKLDREFPLSKDELARLNGFLTGLRQVGLSTQTFRADKDPLKAFDQSGKLTTAMQNLRKVLDDDPRKKAIIYSNFIEAGINPYAAALERDGIPAGVFHGGISPEKRRRALQDYNAGKLRALLLGPAAAEGISTKGTSLIQLLDPHWNEARLQQAQGRGLRFDSHHDMPEELKNVAVQRYLNKSEEPKTWSKLFGGKRHRTADEILARLTAEKEQLNEEFRNLLREVGTRPRNKSE